MGPSCSFISKAGNTKARHIRVLVHGYLSARDERNRSRLLELIPQPAADEEIFLACWDAGRVQEVLTRSLQGAAAGFVGFNKATLARSAVLAVKGSVQHFRDTQDRALRAGADLFSGLAQALSHYPRVEQVSLYGHSLGARVVVEAMKRQDSRLPVQDVVLMGAACVLSAAELEQILPHLRGRLLNCYSRRDKVLLARQGTGKWAGRHPLSAPAYPDKLDNLQLEIGHSDYWQLLDAIFAKTANPQADIEFKLAEKPTAQRVRQLSKQLAKLRKTRQRE